MSEGYFITHVYTANAQIPIPDATVVITQGNQLLATRTTNISGITAPLAIPTPDASASQSPGTERPFAVIDVVVDHPEYIRISAKNIQIFPGVTTHQDFQLIPTTLLPESWDQTENLNTPPQNL